MFKSLVLPSALSVFVTFTEQLLSVCSNEAPRHREATYLLFILVSVTSNAGLYNIKF